MGNEICGRTCLNRKPTSVVTLPSLKSVGKLLEPDVNKIITIQRFIRNLKLRKTVRLKIINNKLEKKKTIKQQTCEFKESWDSCFKKIKDKDYSVNNLNSLKYEATAFYSKLLGKEIHKVNEDIFDNMIDHALEKTKTNKKIIISEEKLSVLKRNNFLSESRILILKIMSESYDFGYLNLELNKIFIEIYGVNNNRESSIEEKKTLENLEDDWDDEIEKQNNSLIKSLNLKQNKNKNIFLEKSDMEGENNFTVFKKIDQNYLLNKLADPHNDWSKKETYKTDKSGNSKTNCKSTDVNVTFTSHDGKNFRKELNFAFKNKLSEKKKISLITRNGKFYDALTLEVNIQKINSIKDKECNFINFLDENSKFYKGGFHLKRLCKYGIGYEYNLNNTIKTKYYGYFENDLYEGLGHVISEKGDLYLGEFRSGKKTGWGKIMQMDGAIKYKGFLKNGQFHGYGELDLAGKYDYCGTFVDGLKDGFGYLTFSDGSVYCGQFKKDKMSGLGLFKWPGGHKYYGSMKNDKLHGLGKYTWAKGEYYIGCYENDLRHGSGKYYFINGATLTGFWRNSKKEGKFELCENNQKMFLYYQNDLQVARYN